MSNYNSGLFVGSDGKVYDATNGMSDTGLTADVSRYAYNSGLFISANGEIVDITALIRSESSGGDPAPHSTIEMEVGYEDDTTETFHILVEDSES